MPANRKRLFGVLLGAVLVVVGLVSVVSAKGRQPGLAHRPADSGSRAGLGGQARSVGSEARNRAQDEWFEKTGMNSGTGPSARAWKGLGLFGHCEQWPGSCAILSYVSERTGTPADSLLEELLGGKTLKEVVTGSGLDWAEIEAVVGDCVNNRDRIRGACEEHLEEYHQRRATKEMRLRGRTQECS